jgi:hypothetical protein
MYVDLRLEQKFFAFTKTPTRRPAQKLVELGCNDVSYFSAKLFAPFPVLFLSAASFQVF